MARYIHIKLYDAERYHEGRSPTITKNINIVGKSQKQIDEEIVVLRNEQNEKNKAFRHKEPKKGPGIYYEMRKEQQEEANRNEQQLETISKIVKGNKLKIPFDIGTGNTFVLFGASKSGKTTMMMKIYNEYFPEYYPLKRTLTTLFAMNPQLPIYTRARESRFIISCPRLDQNVEKYIDWQRKINKMNDNKFIFLNMFDDFIDVRYTSIVNNLILTYRNSNMSAIMCLQYVNLLSKAARSNVNNVFLMHMNTDESIEVAVNVYLRAILKKLSIENAVQWYRDITSDHNYVYINPTHGIVYLSMTHEFVTY